METALHILKRLLLMLAGYFFSVLIGLFAIVALYAFLSSLASAPDYFAAFSMTPVAVLLIPPLGVFIYFMALLMTCTQTLIFALIGEVFSLRQLWLHMLFGAGSATSGYAILAPISANGGWALTRWDLGIVAGAGLVGGMVYWLIAGRDAGFRRPLPAVSLQ